MEKDLHKAKTSTKNKTKLLNTSSPSFASNNSKYIRDRKSHRQPRLKHQLGHATRNDLFTWRKPNSKNYSPDTCLQLQSRLGSPVYIELSYRLPLLILGVVALIFIFVRSMYS
ncbi:hypothetical protein CIPAW_07G095500 [Carya illinoinensis]|uniref:Uncharacterized protein n=1 Tax=Carya illinoinensis TaxID=32201 RepID=A0A8T1Q0N7_CARIL|nr:hypothetical protein CIPAW_07G095500 [Carya illinoinensis]